MSCFSLAFWEQVCIYIVIIYRVVVAVAIAAAVCHSVPTCNCDLDHNYSN